MTWDRHQINRLKMTTIVRRRISSNHIPTEKYGQEIELGCILVTICQFSTHYDQYSSCHLGYIDKLKSSWALRFKCCFEWHKKDIKIIVFTSQTLWEEVSVPSHIPTDSYGQEKVVGCILVTICQFSTHYEQYSSCHMCLQR